MPPSWPCRLKRRAVEQADEPDAGCAGSLAHSARSARVIGEPLCVRKTMKRLPKTDQGRAREASEIVRLRRAAAVGRLMLGELHAPLDRIEHEHYVAKPRRELKAEVAALRSSLRKELRKFCQQNFVNVSPEKLGDLYEDIRAHDSQYRLPLDEFVKRVGEPRSNVLKGAPAHATICLSPWGLQTEFPEMHLARDLALSYNDALDAEGVRGGHGKVPWRKAKEEDFRRPLAAALIRGKFSMRMCLLSCFNLTEAFINGIAWEFVQSSGAAGLSKNQQDLLTKGQASLLDKLAKVPAIVTGRERGPLTKGQAPLSTFRDLVKPFRDSIVHASPFSAPERFGGYDKLERVYELEMPTVTNAVELTLKIVGTIHEFMGSGHGLPAWLPRREAGGRFVVE